MNIRAKFMLQDVTSKKYGTSTIYYEFVFRPQYDDTIPEDRRFSKATPTGEMRMTVDNPPVVEYLKSQLGSQFYFDISPCQDVEPSAKE